MTRLTLPKLTFMIAVVDLVLALWLVVSIPPREYPGTKAERQAAEACDRLYPRSNFVIRPVLKLIGKTPFPDGAYERCMKMKLPPWSR